MSTAAGASMLAHGLHVTMLLAGLWGLAALLLPHVLHRHGPAWARPGPAVVGPAVATDPPTVATAGRLTLASGIDSAESAGTAPALGLPLALVASTTAAGIHAAVALPHLREELVLGVLLAVAAGFQVAWTSYAAAHRGPAALASGVVLHGGLVVLWLLSRTAGLPVVAAERHPLGPWDVACVAWQVVAVVACVALLRARAGHEGPRLGTWAQWPASSRAAVGLAACSLVLLSLSGAHS